MLMTNDMETHKFWIVCHLTKRQVQSAAAISESVLIAEIKSKKGRIISVFHSRSVLYYIIYNDKVQEKQKGVSGWWYTDIHNILNSLSFCTYFCTCSSCFSLRCSARYSGFLSIQLTLPFPCDDANVFLMKMINFNLNFWAQNLDMCQILTGSFCEMYNLLLAEFWKKMHH